MMGVASPVGEFGWIKRRCCGAHGGTRTTSLLIRGTQASWREPDLGRYEFSFPTSGMSRYRKVIHPGSSSSQ